MNVGKGLKRISAVFFGLIGLIFAAFLIGNLDNKSGLGCLAGVFVALVLHRLTCWIIDGFSGG